MEGDFWSGVRLAVNGLADAAKKASYCLGFGAGGLGVALVLVTKFAIDGPPALLIPLSAFFILARLGKALDDHLDRTFSTRAKALPSSKRFEENMRELQNRLASLEQRQDTEMESLKSNIQQFKQESQSGQRLDQ
jgi:cell shape-determining protein MreC